MKEYEIRIDLEIGIPEKMLDLIVDTIKDEVAKHSFKKYISDIYWDES